MPDPVVQPRPTAPAIPVEYQRSRELIDALWNDATVGPAIRKAAKAKYPDVTLPDDSFEPIVAPLRQQVEELQKTLKEEREQRAKDTAAADEARSKRTIEDALTSARKSYNLTDEGFDKMVARMKETGNYTDADAAAAWVISKEPPPRQPGPTFGPNRLDVARYHDDDARKLLLKDNEAFLDNELNDFSKDPDKYVRETFGQAA